MGNVFYVGLKVVNCAIKIQISVNHALSDFIWFKTNVSLAPAIVNNAVVIQLVRFYSMPIVKYWFW